MRSGLHGADPAATSSPGRSRATMSRSLSPRPDRLTRHVLLGRQGRAAVAARRRSRAPAPAPGRSRTGARARSGRRAPRHRSRARPPTDPRRRGRRAAGRRRGSRGRRRPNAAPTTWPSSVLGQHREGAVQHARPAQPERGRVVAEPVAASAGLHRRSGGSASSRNGREHADRVAAAADAGDGHVRQAPDLLQHLRARLAPDHRLQLAHHARDTGAGRPPIPARRTSSSTLATQSRSASFSASRSVPLPVVTGRTSAPSRPCGRRSAPGARCRWCPCRPRTRGRAARRRSRSPRRAGRLRSRR